MNEQFVLNPPTPDPFTVRLELARTAYLLLYACAGRASEGVETLTRLRAENANDDAFVKALQADIAAKKPEFLAVRS